MSKDVLLTNYSSLLQRSEVKTDETCKDTKLDLAALMKEGSMTFAAAMAKHTGGTVETPPDPSFSAEPSVFLEDLHRRIVR